jgi:hypothetical protein
MASPGTHPPHRRRGPLCLGALVAMALLSGAAAAAKDKPTFDTVSDVH